MRLAAARALLLPTPAPTRTTTTPLALRRNRNHTRSRPLIAMSAWACDYVPDAASGGTSPAPYAAALERFLSSGPAAPAASARFVVFTSDLVDGRYWCPDCVTTVPAVRKAAEKAGVPLLEVGVGDRAAWRGNAAHPFRAPPLSISGVPTLVRLSADGKAVAARLGPELEAAGTPKAAEKLAAEFFAAAPAAE